MAAPHRWPSSETPGIRSEVRTSRIRGVLQVGIFMCVPEAEMGPTVKCGFVREVLRASEERRRNVQTL